VLPAALVKNSPDDNKINQPPLDNKGIPLQQYLQKEQVLPAAQVKKIQMITRSTNPHWTTREYLYNSQIVK
jgi:hypothetical protein